MPRDAESSSGQSNNSEGKLVASPTEKGNQENPDSSNLGNTPLDIAVSNFNLDLLPGVREDFRNVNWYKVWADTFLVGVYLTLIWAAFILCVLILYYLTTASLGIPILARLASVVPLIPVALAIFGITARWSWRRMEDTPPPEDTIVGRIKYLSISGSSTLFLISIFSLVLAFTFRAAIHYASVTLYGPELSFWEVLEVVILDGIYVGLLLVGMGGLASLYFTGDNER